MNGSSMGESSMNQSSMNESGMIESRSARLAEVFATVRSQGRAALIGYLPAGFPTHQGSIDALLAMVDAGVDIVEVGLPYSDPLMDGPTIQAATEIALRNGNTTADSLRVVAAVARTGAPTLVMTYWNLVERYGVERFAGDLADAGGAGMITPDLTPEEGGAWFEAAKAHDLDRVLLVAPSSTEERLRIVTAASSGFVYAASTMGVTGARTSLSGAAEALVARTRVVTDLPIAVGLGVSSGEQAAAVASFADGVIVGSAFVRCLLDASTPAAGIDAVTQLARELARGVRQGGVREAGVRQAGVRQAGVQQDGVRA